MTFRVENKQGPDAAFALAESLCEFRPISGHGIDSPQPGDDYSTNAIHDETIITRHQGFLSRVFCFILTNRSVVPALLMFNFFLVEVFMRSKCKSTAVLSALVIFLSVLMITPAQAEDKAIRLGVPTTLSSFQGAECLKAVEMAVSEINAAGGVDVGGTKRPFKIYKADLRDGLPGVPVQDALIGLEKMILEDKVHAMVVGPLRSEALLPAMDVLAKHKVPLLETIAMSPAFQAKVKKDPQKYKYIFRNCLDGKYMVGYLVGSMKALEKTFGFNRVMFMVQDVMWARGAAKIVSGIMAKSGWEVLGTEAFPTGASDFSPALLKASSMKAQVIVPLFDMSSSGILAKQWGTMKVPAVLNGNISPIAGPQAWKTYKGKIAGAINIIMESGNIPIPKIKESVVFWEAYKKRYGKPIQAEHGVSASYESVYVLAEAIERAGSLDGDALAEAIAKTDRKGAMGRITFDEGHQLVFGRDPEKAAVGCMFQWSADGKRVPIFPSGIAEGPMTLPPWVKSAK